MIIVRPVKTTDLNDLYVLAGKTKAGLTTLQKDRKLLKQMIAASVKSFKSPARNNGAKTFLFVMENTGNGKVIGTSSIISKIGGKVPFYTYQLKKVKKESSLLNVNKEIEYLQLQLIHDGPTEIGTLFLDPKYRHKSNGRVLSFARFLFMAQYRKYFKSSVIAELRGYIDKKDRSPFWEAVGRHFFKVEFKKADLMGRKDKSFIADLVPRHPIYIPLLPKSAQAVIGKVHENTQPALRLLEQQGFKRANQIDIFEAGPTMKAKIKDVKIVKNSKPGIVKAITDDFNSSLYIVSNTDSVRTFRAVAGGVKQLKGRGVAVSRSVARAINVKIGSKVRFVLLKK